MSVWVFVSCKTSCAALPAILLCVCECERECVCRCGFVRVYVCVVHDFLCGSAGKIGMYFVYLREMECVYVIEFLCSSASEIIVCACV